MEPLPVEEGVMVSVALPLPRGELLGVKVLLWDALGHWEGLRLEVRVGLWDVQAVGESVWEAEAVELRQPVGVTEVLALLVGLTVAVPHSVALGEGVDEYVATRGMET